MSKNRTYWLIGVHAPQSESAAKVAQKDKIRVIRTEHDCANGSIAPNRSFEGDVVIGQVPHTRFMIPVTT